MALYAAYGSNMDPAQMLLRCPHSPQRGTGWLEGWRLTFGGEDLGWDGALTTVVEDTAQRVFVALYDVPEVDEKELDSWDGMNLGFYRKLKVRVQIEEAGTRLSLQEARRLADMVERQDAKQEFRVRLPMAAMSEQMMDRLEKLFAGAPGISQVVFELEAPDGSVCVLPSQQRVKATPELLEAVRRMRSEAAAA